MNIREYCRRILESGDLESKLAPPPALAVEDDGPPLHIDRPARAPGLRLRSGAGRLPKLSELGKEEAKGVTLARFAHHELMAIELFAWALLRWPEMPSALRRGFLHTLKEEQDHLRLYLEQLQAMGQSLEDHVLSDYFWKLVPGIEAHPRGPLAFLCAMGLTLEQANLDFSLLYRDAFRRVGDEAAAEVLQKVHDDEIGHVKLAAVWLRRLKDPSLSEVEAYQDAVPFPLSAARAKGRNFTASPRRRAGLSEEMIALVQKARPGE